jgi:hypothetical protein
VSDEANDNRLDIAELRERLREYDPNEERCDRTAARKTYFCDDLETGAPLYYHTTRPCVRLAGHSGDCRDHRAVIGWPGREVIAALLDEVEFLRGRRDNLQGVLP